MAGQHGRRLRITAAIIILMLGVTSCMSNKNTNPEALREKASQYLEATYQDRFTALSYAAGSWAYGYERIYFAPERYPGATVEVRAYQNEDGSYRFLDNYFKCYMEEDAVRFFAGKLSGTEPLTVRVRFPDMIWSDEPGEARSFDAWVAAGTCFAEVFYITREELPAPEREQIVDGIRADGIEGTVTFLVTADGGCLRSYTLDEILNRQKDLVTAKSEYSVTRQ